MSGVEATILKITIEPGYSVLHAYMSIIRPDMKHPLAGAATAVLITADRDGCSCLQG